MKGLVLAGGHGTRLRPLTFTGNKHMIPIANQPILFYGLKHLAEAGVRDVAVILGPIQEGIRENVGDGSAFGLNVEYIVQGEPKGLAHAVKCAREFLGDDPFVMYLGDNLLQSGVRPFLARYESDRPAAVVGATPVSHPESYGVVEVSDGRILSLEEKPLHPKSNLALIGVYLFGPEIHPIVESLVPSKRGELEITEAIWKLCQTRRRVSVLKVDGWWKDTGRPEDLLEANDQVLETAPQDQFILAGTVSDGAQITGKVRLGSGSFVGPRAQVEGPTVIGNDVRIDGPAHIGPRTAIGDRCVINGSTIRRSIIMDGTEINGSVDVTDSLIGRSARIHVEKGEGLRIACILGDSTQLRL
jgi:glucose-1-phosphate thymidylyltransferase